MSDADRKAKEGGSTRIRASIYGERKILTVRMSQELNARLMAHCDIIHETATSYISVLLENVIEKNQRINLGRFPPHTGKKIVVTVRMQPELHHRLMLYCKEFGVSANWLSLFLIQRDLDLKERKLTGRR